MLARLLLARAAAGVAARAAGATVGVGEGATWRRRQRRPSSSCWGMASGGGGGGHRASSAPVVCPRCHRPGHGAADCTVGGGDAVHTTAAAGAAANDARTSAGEVSNPEAGFPVPSLALTTRSEAGANAAVDYVVDGSMLEGGGQILRVSTALAAITCHSLTVHHIRAGRAKPGLRPQHLRGLEAARDVCGGDLSHAHVGSESITLRPGELRVGEYEADTRTAGSCTLLAQAVVPCLVYARGGRGESVLVCKGGTDNPAAPPADYLEHALAPVLRQHFGINIKIKLERRGFYPKGGGRMSLRVGALPAGKALPPIQLTDQGKVVRVEARGFVSGRHKLDALKVELKEAQRFLRQHLDEGVDINDVTAVQETSGVSAIGDGMGLMLIAYTNTGCVLASNTAADTNTNTLGRHAAEELLCALDAGATVDIYMQDQLIVFMALAGGTSVLNIGRDEPTLHARTAAAVANALTGAECEFARDESRGGVWMLTCEGVAWTKPI